MSASGAPLISVCVLAGHGHDALRSCLRSLCAQSDAPSFEVVAGVSESAAEMIVRDMFPDAIVCTIDHGPPGRRRNALLEHASGQVLLFLDDDVTVAPDLLRELASVARRWPEVAVFGGPNATPEDSSAFQQVQGAVLSSLVGSGPVSRRYGARRAGVADERWFTLCNLAVRREAMVHFDQNLTCAEENAALAELRSRGAPMRYEPTLRVFHTRRPTWSGFARQMFKYGRGRGQLLARQPHLVRLAFLTPSALLLYGLAVAILALITGSAPAVGWFVPLAAYGVLVLSGSARIAATLGDARAVPSSVALTLLLHVCYGSGVLYGFALPGTGRARRLHAGVRSRLTALASRG